MNTFRLGRSTRVTHGSAHRGHLREGLLDCILSPFQGLDACFLGVFTRLMMVTCAECLFACLACVKQRGRANRNPNTCFVGLLYSSSLSARRRRR